MPENYTPSPFAAAVGSFLQTYSTVSGIKQDKQAAADRKRAANRADELQRIQMDQAGYDEITMPTIEAPPPQNFEQGVAQHLRQFFSGGPDEPGSIVVKTHPSAHDTDMQAQFQNERDLESMREAIATNRFNATQAGENARAAATQSGENARSAANNATSLKVAGIDHSVQAQALADRQRTEFFDTALQAAGGDAVQAMSNVEKYQMPQARKFGATRTDYHAAAARYRDSKAALTREGIDAANERAAARGGTQILPKDLNGKPIPPPAPTATGQQSRDWDSAAAAARAQGKDPVALLGPRPSQQQTSAATPNATTRNTPLRSLTTAEKSQAHRDPSYAAQLTSAGYSGRDVFGPLRPSDKANAQTDPGFAQHLTGLGYKKGIDF